VRVTPTRDDMVLQLRQLGIRDARVLDGMARVPREEFVRDVDRDLAYEDRALPIDLDQTISQPYVVARMTELLEIDSRDRVLEVGTGSGYQAAVLGELAGEVVSVELHEALAAAARDRLARLGYKNVRVEQGDGSVGFAAAAPYDGIIVTAAAPSLDPELASQLTKDGRIVAPVGPRELQELIVLRADGRLERHGKVGFVPLRGRAGFTP
jgi:protein-L-isoaspartate(D-aspartate) O-methyltransferase